LVTIGLVRSASAQIGEAFARETRDFARSVTTSCEVEVHGQPLRRSQLFGGHRARGPLRRVGGRIPTRAALQGIEPVSRSIRARSWGPCSAGPSATNPGREVLARRSPVSSSAATLVRRIAQSSAGAPVRTSCDLVALAGALGRGSVFGDRDA
jgi:hypothetical protein